MSEDKRKVIHVKDLVIKADNVYIEPKRSHYDPFFGPRRRDVRDQRDESVESENREHDHDHDQDNDEDKNERGPFSWI